MDWGNRPQHKVATKSKTGAAKGKGALRETLRAKGRNAQGASRLVSAFGDFDVNDSGYLDYTELRAALGHYGLDVSTHGAQEILAAYDDTPDGKLDKAEWAELVKDIEAVAKPTGQSATRATRSASSTRRRVGPAKAKTSSVDAVFARFDVNGSGFLDYRELRAALRHYGLDVSTHGAQEILAAYDDTPDGKLDKAEWAELVKDIETAVSPSKARSATGAGSSTRHSSLSSKAPSNTSRQQGQQPPWCGSSRVTAATYASRKARGSDDESSASDLGDSWANRGRPLDQRLRRTGVAPRSSAAHYGMPGRESFAAPGGMEESAAVSSLSKLQFVCHELGLASHGTRVQLMERLGYHFKENGMDAPVGDKIEELFQKILTTPGGGPMGGARPFDDVLRSEGRWSSDRDRTGPYRRLHESGGMVSNTTQRRMMHR